MFHVSRPVYKSSVTKPRVSELKDELTELLRRSELWLEALGETAYEAGNSRTEYQTKAALLQALRTRNASTLLTVGMFGAYSSGKSLLLSGLQGGLEVRERETDFGQMADQFVSLLPSASRATTAVPARIVPVGEDSGVEASGRGFLRVRFEDSDDDQWEDVGNSPAPAILAAYATVGADRANRLDSHWNREVAEIELSIADFRVPAKLYDLPGYGSPNAIHDQIVKSAVIEADCFIYVTHATKTLSEHDLDLIRYLYQHCRSARKRVLWVVTAIDLATQVDDSGTPAWKDTVEQNNLYLRENFTEDGRPDAVFIGEGFIPVSPALEARAAMLEARGDIAKANNCIAASRMDTLRQALQGLIEGEAGHKYIANAATEAKNTIGPLTRELEQRVANERLPLDELARVLADQKRYLSHLDGAIPELRQALSEDLKHRVERSARPFRHLADHFHAHLDAKIRATDLYVPRKANQIQVHKAQILQSWLEAPDGPATLWDKQLASFKANLRSRVEECIDADEPADSLAVPPLDMDSLTEPRMAAHHKAPHDLVKNTAAVIGIATPVGATAAWLGSVAGAGALFPPAAVVAGAAAVVFMGVQLLRRAATSLDLLRQEWVRALDKEADEVRQQFIFAIGIQGEKLIENLDDNLDDYRRQVEDAAQRVRDRINDPDHRMRKELVDKLEPLSAEGKELTARLTQLARLRR
ncbi:ElaB/YqjD/DUF883 family membrane-anchored ribosome-binding protein [Catenulispora sp. MAP12-49]